MKKFTTLHTSEPTFSVSELNRQIQQLLEASLPWILVEGEISNLARPASGHWYFSLKDDKAQIRCAMFKNRNSAVRFRPKDGDHVRLRAKVTFYGPRGDCQLTVESMESGGEGALQAAYDRLKAKLQLEGLFEQNHKKPLPKRPERIAIITSPAGAAIRDMIIAFRRRFPLTELTILPSLVQGQGSAANLTKQLERADSSGHFDAIIIGRGGGSLEDLWSFNDELLARSIFHCTTPIVSAVGHETDFTIADFVADIRAATPTAAAELLSPEISTLLSGLKQSELKLTRRIESITQTAQQRLDFLLKRIRHPKERLDIQQDKLHNLNHRLKEGIQKHLDSKQVRLEKDSIKLMSTSPMRTIVKEQAYIEQLERRLNRALKSTMTSKATTFTRLVEQLNLVSPLNTLARGYAIATQDKKVIRSKDDVSVGSTLNIKVEDGSFDCQVTHIDDIEKAF
ncbi:exodeoxyribonuclease VII large subunit [Marinomonas mediterranea]|uniref:exodeoxyribonuclease VII large subunit n=1 Tax=Marinomonas mediterranea TaxID=119864 RepID=UPI00234ABC1B|nr:exodeoxyribonuclease VII large subunit [Marinomonas mediterranea]WCN07716.1 exodeoxyribonuclease VII large subunit [Marinomonas mediterranea]WCN11817.1 exodeoxyribonuclease VII large subunit [Marinomonas mediterranea]